MNEEKQECLPALCRAPPDCVIVRLTTHNANSCKLAKTTSKLFSLTNLKKTKKNPEKLFDSLKVISFCFKPMTVLIY